MVTRVVRSGRLSGKELQNVSLGTLPTFSFSTAVSSKSVMSTTAVLSKSSQGTMFAAFGTAAGQVASLQLRRQVLMDGSRASHKKRVFTLSCKPRNPLALHNALLVPSLSTFSNLSPQFLCICPDHCLPPRTPRISLNHLLPILHL